jgi:hypothetical protein
MIDVEQLAVLSRDLRLHRIFVLCATVVQATSADAA